MKKIFIFIILSLSLILSSPQAYSQTFNDACFVSSEADSFRLNNDPSYPFISSNNARSFRQQLDNFRNNGCPAIIEISRPRDGAVIRGLDGSYFDSAIYFMTAETHLGTETIDMSDQGNEINLRTPLFFKNSDRNLIIGNWTDESADMSVTFKNKNNNWLHEFPNALTANLRLAFGRGHDFGRAVLRFDNMRVDDPELRNNLPQRNGHLLPFVCHGYEEDLRRRDAVKHVLMRNITIHVNGFDKEDLFGTYVNGRYTPATIPQARCLRDAGGVEVVNEDPDDDPDEVEDPVDGGIPVFPGGGLPDGGVPVFPDGGFIPDEGGFPQPGDPVEDPVQGPDECAEHRWRYYYADNDGDNYIDLSSEVIICPGDPEPRGYRTVFDGTDCDDNDPDVLSTKMWRKDLDGDFYYPEIMNRDEDLKIRCSAPDGDGWHALTDKVEDNGIERFYFLNRDGVFDCDDTDPNKNPFLGCAGDFIDEDAIDRDGDGQCGNSVFQCFCEAPEGVDPLNFDRSNCPISNDCNNDDPTIYTGAEERDDFCSLAFEDPTRDANCDGDVDINHPNCKLLDGIDSDSDGYCGADESCCPEGEESCEFQDADGFMVTILGHTDCNDDNPSISPDQTENSAGVCSNAQDDDCDGLIDAADDDCAGVGFPGGISPQDIDDDGDGYSENAGDCNDENAQIRPNAIEICGNGKDDNCDNQEDEGCIGLASFDNDGDGYCEGEFVGDTFELTCDPTQLAPNGGPVLPGDCADDDASIHPGALEIACDGVDNNCDGLKDLEFGQSPADVGSNLCVTKDPSLDEKTSPTNGFDDFFSVDRPSRATNGSVGTCSLQAGSGSFNLMSFLLIFAGVFVVFRIRKKAEHKI